MPALAELKVGTGIGAASCAVSCTILAGSNSTILFFFAGNAVSSLAGAGAAPDPATDVKGELVFGVGTGAAVLVAAWLGCCPSTSGAAAIVIGICAAGAGTIAGLPSTFADAVISGDPP